MFKRFSTTCGKYEQFHWYFIQAAIHFLSRQLSRGIKISYIKVKKCSSFWETESPDPLPGLHPLDHTGNFHLLDLSPRPSIRPLCQIFNTPLYVYSILEANLVFSYSLNGASKCFEFASKLQKPLADEAPPHTPLRDFCPQTPCYSLSPNF